MSSDPKLNEKHLADKLKSEDPVELPMNDLFFDELHDKIMAKVNESEIQTVSKKDELKTALRNKWNFIKPENNLVVLKLIKMSLTIFVIATSSLMAYKSYQLLNESQYFQSKEKMAIRYKIENKEKMTAEIARMIFNSISNIEKNEIENSQNYNGDLASVALLDVNSMTVDDLQWMHEVLSKKLSDTDLSEIKL